MACPPVSVMPAWGDAQGGGKGSHWIPLQDGDERTDPERSLGHVMRTATEPTDKEKERKIEQVRGIWRISFPAIP